MMTYSEKTEITKALLPLNLIFPYRLDGFNEDNREYLSIFLTKLAEENIIFTPKCINALMKSSGIYLEELYRELCSVNGIKFRNSFGTGRDINLTYTEAIEQLEHYFITYGLEYIDEELLEDKKDKFLEFESSSRVKVIDSISEEEYFDLLKNIVNSPIVFGETQQNILKASEYQLNKVIKDITEIKVKENMLYLISVNKSFRAFIKTSTDLLRYIYFINDLDFRDIKSIPSKELKLKLTTSQKRFIMEFFNRERNSSEINSLLEDLKRYKSYWIRVSNNLKPMSKKYSRYNKAQYLFKILKNNNIRTFFSYYDDKSIIEKAYHLSSKPGEFIRRIDSLIRNATEEDILGICDIINSMEFNPKLLMQIIPYLRYRTDSSINSRIFNVKGKSVLIDDKPLEKLDKARTNIIINALTYKLQKHLENKKLFSNFILSDELKSYIVPTEIRDLSVSNGIRYTPGTRIKISAKYLRAFTAWGTKKGNSNFDIDLSGMFVDKDGEFRAISYYNQSENYAQHSGDFTSCIEYKPGNSEITAEYIDINIDKAKKYFDYIVLNSIIFSSSDKENDFNTDVYSYSGLMERDERSNKNININDSLFKMTLSGKFQSHIPFAVDLKTSEIVFIDKYFNSQRGANIASNSSNVELFKREYFNSNEYKMNMYSLLSSIQNPDLEDGEEPVLIDNQFVSDHLEEIINLLN